MINNNKHTKHLLYPLSMLALLTFNNPAFAEKIYSWKDELGSTHYTNNPALVPLQPNDSRVIKMKDISPPPPPKDPVSGKRIWDTQCSSCHLIAAQGRNGLRSMRKLVDSINDPSTTPSLDIIILQAALDDQMDDLAKIELSPEEIQAVANYIRKQVIQNKAESATKPPQDKP